MDKYRVAIIGLGRIGVELETDPYRQKPASHLGAWLTHPKCQVVGLCDIMGVAPSLVDATGAEHFVNYEDMMNKTKPDIVSIATPDDTHKQIARNVVRYEPVKLVFLEKPIATTVSDAESIVFSAREFKVKLAINHTRRWNPVWQHVAKLANEDKALSFFGKFNGDLLREGTHMTDLANWFGAEKQGFYWGEGKLDYLLWEVDLFWKNKRIHVKENGRVSEMYQSFPSKHYNSHIRELEKTCEVRRNLYPGSDMKLAIDQLVECLDKDDDPLCTGEHGKRALETLLSASWNK